MLSREEPVGLVILLSEPCDAQPGHSSTKLRSAIAEARHRISFHEEQRQKEELKALRAEISVLSVKEKFDFSEKCGDKSTVQMEDGKLVWYYNELSAKKEEAKGVVRIMGPLGWNRKTSELSGHSKDNTVFISKPDPEGVKELEKQIVSADVPMMVMRSEARAAELRTAVEAVGQLVGGRVNNSAPQELYRLLRQHDKEEWENMINGKRGVPGLLEAYYAGGVKIANGPGFELIGDKELCAYIDKFIRHYLDEEPILRTIPTRSFANDEGLIRNVFDNPHTQGNVVVKRVDGRGGDAVWVGAKLSRADFTAARPLVVAEPEAFIVQKYTALSQVDGQLVDLRGLSFICSSDVDDLSGGPGAGVSPVLWGRGIPAEGSNGKVNISDSGFEFAIVTNPDC